MADQKSAFAFGTNQVSEPTSIFKVNIGSILKM